MWIIYIYIVGVANKGLGYLWEVIHHVSNIIYEYIVVWVWFDSVPLLWTISNLFIAIDI